MVHEGRLEDVLATVSLREIAEAWSCYHQRRFDREPVADDDPDPTGGRSNLGSPTGSRSVRRASPGMDSLPSWKRHRKTYLLTLVPAP